MALVTTATVKETANSSEVFAGDRPGTTLICKNPEKLQMLVASLTEHNCVHFVSNGDWSTHDLVMLLLSTFGRASLHFTTYAIREYPIRLLLGAMDRQELSSVHMLVDYRAKIRTPEVFQLAAMNVNHIALTAVHAKVCVLQFDNLSISINGSANWTSNPRLEAGVITTEKSIADFHISWITKALHNAEIFE